MMQVENIDQSLLLNLQQNLSERIKCNEILSIKKEARSDMATETSQQEQGCGCKCCRQGYNKAEVQQKRRLKRKEYRTRIKSKLKQQKDRAFKDLQLVITKIYALQTTFMQNKHQIQQSFDHIKDRTRFSFFINQVIRDEVDGIRDKINNCLELFLMPITQQNGFKEECLIIRQFVELFGRVQKASPQIELLINFFIEKTSLEDSYIPQQKRLDQMTYRYILKQNDFQNSYYLQDMCARAFQNPEVQSQDKQIIGFLISILDKEEAYETDSESYEHQSDSHYVENQNTETIVKSRRRRRKTKQKTHSSSAEQALQKKLQNIILQQKRLQCNVHSSWIQHIKLKQIQYRHSDLK